MIIFPKYCKAEELDKCVVCGKAILPDEDEERVIDGDHYHKECLDEQRTL